MATPEEQETLARAMWRVGIPDEQTRAIMDALRIWRIGDLHTLTYDRLMNVARVYWQAIIDLRNRHVDGNVTLMYISRGM